MAKPLDCAVCPRFWCAARAGRGRGLTHEFCVVMLHPPKLRHTQHSKRCRDCWSKRTWQHRWTAECLNNTTLSRLCSRYKTWRSLWTARYARAFWCTARANRGPGLTHGSCVVMLHPPKLRHTQHSKRSATSNTPASAGETGPTESGPVHHSGISAGQMNVPHCYRYRAGATPPLHNSLAFPPCRAM